MQDTINSSDGRIQTFVVPEIGNNEFCIQVADFAVVSSLANHEPRPISSKRKLP
jgi:hypothetical protein